MRLLNTASSWAVLALLGWHGAVRADAAQDFSRGAALYEARCQKCHSISINDVGPRHQNVVGRRAGSVPDFMYSAALRNSTIVWTEDMLDRWLSDPEALVPGQEMDVQVKSAEDRRLLILYLKSLTAQAPSFAPSAATDRPR